MIEMILQEKFLINHPSEAAEVFNKIYKRKTAAIISEYSAEIIAPVFEKILPDIAAEVVAELPEEQFAKILEILPHYYAINVLSRLASGKQKSILNLLLPKTKKHLQEGLAYPSDCAGALMETDFIALQPHVHVAQAIQHLKQIPKSKTRRIVFIVNDEFHLISMVDLQTLLLSKKDNKLSELAKPVYAVVQATDNKDVVVDILEKFRITDLPVIDFEGKLLGLIPYDTLIETSREEASADILTMVGASKDERALSPPWFAIRKRLPWLQINLLTAFIAASVVGLFENTIATYTVLAVLLPIVAGQSGNTGSQALAVTIRGLALREITSEQWWKILFKECRVGIVNGLAVALTTSLGVYLWSRSTGLSIIIGLSMIFSMIIASMAGAAVPITLSACKQDPAQSSSVVLTTITDVVGFFSFLGIATLLSNLLG